MQILNPCAGKQYLRCMASCRIRRFCHCLHIQMHSHTHLFLFIHSHARYLACSQKSFPFANRNQLANGTKCLRTGQNVRERAAFADGTEYVRKRYNIMRSPFSDLEYNGNRSKARRNIAGNGDFCHVFHGTSMGFVVSKIGGREVSLRIFPQEIFLYSIRYF